VSILIGVLILLLLTAGVLIRIAVWAVGPVLLFVIILAGVVLMSGCATQPSYMRSDRVVPGQTSCYEHCIHEAHEHHCKKRERTRYKLLSHGCIWYGDVHP